MTTAQDCADMPHPTERRALVPRAEVLAAFGRLSSTNATIAELDRFADDSISDPYDHARQRSDCGDDTED
ncbi:hypothetical protein [Nocardia testacea]|uniref:hypothetical protein n=1 Tax=Nocardia testacea TaxID=248551 RepID=UPI0005855018|nr:hypothetical protein [Nocardia testacea]